MVMPPLVPKTVPVAFVPPRSTVTLLLVAVVVPKFTTAVAAPELAPFSALLLLRTRVPLFSAVVPNGERVWRKLFTPLNVTVPVWFITKLIGRVEAAVMLPVNVVLPPPVKVSVELVAVEPEKELTIRFAVVGLKVKLDATPARLEELIEPT